MRKLVLVHTVPPLIAVFDNLVGELLPDVAATHVLDELILELDNKGEHARTAVAERLHSHVALASELGASAVLVTCSTISPRVDDVAPHATIPVLKIDAAMIARAVELGTSIGVVATAASTLAPTRQMLQDRAQAAGREVDIELVLVENALEALLKGAEDTHDRLVRDAVLELAGRVDVVVLAQASMARVLNVIPEGERPVPVLSSPHLALERVRTIVSAEPPAERSHE
jgi:Asp/Glu/hydantoin racemase